MGTFANSSGVIVGSPFTIGDGPVFEVIPAGATQLLLGFNDEWYNDNGGSLSVKVTEVAGVAAPVPPGFWFEWTISIPPQ